MKKVISLFLVMLLCIPAALPSFAMTENPAVTESSEAVALLEFLGIMDKGETLSDNVMRADFAMYVAKAIKEDVISDGVQYYHDVEPDMWAAGAIGTLTGLGYFSGGEKGTFRPEDDIKLAEACKVLMCLLGYEKMCVAKGGYPYGYTEVAYRLGITKGIGSEHITKEQMALMLFRALNSGFFTISEISAEDARYAVDENSTPLSIYHELYSVKGIVNAVGNISIDSAGGVDENKMRIGNKVIRTDALSEDMFDYLGMTVKAYYVDAQDGSLGGAMVFPYEKHNETVSIMADKVTSVSDNGNKFTFTYLNKNNKSDSISIPKGCIVIKNGENVTTDLYNSIKISKGHYKFLDNDRDGQYDFLFVSEYYNLTVGQVDNAEGMVYITTSNGYVEYYRGTIGSKIVIYDKDNPLKKVDVTRERNRVIKIKNTAGQLISVSDIEVGEVLSVYKSKSGNYVEICRGKGSVTGTVETLGEDGERYVLTINDTEYKMDKALSDNAKVKIKPGQSGTFVLDMFGEIGYYDVEQAGILYGYLVAVGHNRSFNKKTEVKIFDQNGNMGIYTVRDNLKLDGGKVKKSEDAKDKLAPYLKQMIRFSIDENSLVDFVDTLYEDKVLEGNISIRETLPYAKYTYQGGYRGFEPNQVVSSDAFVFLTPTDTAIDSGSYDDSWFRIQKVSNFSSTSSYYVSTYRADPQAVCEDVVLRKMDGGSVLPLSNPPSLVTDIRYGIDNDGCSVALLTVYEGNNPSYVKADESALAGWNINRGDLVWFQKNHDGKIIRVFDVLVNNGNTLEFKTENSEGADKTHYSKKYGTDDTFENLQNSGIGARFSVICGYAGIVDNGAIKLAYTKDGCKNEKYDIARVLTGKNIIVFDRNTDENGTAYWGGIDDIVDYRRGGEDCSMVIVYESQHSPKIFYVYK